MPDHIPVETQFFLLGYSDDTRALLDHLRAEAPDLLTRVVVVDADQRPAAHLRSLGVRMVWRDPWDLFTLVETGVQQAKIVVISPTNPSGQAEKVLALVRALRRLCPQTRLFARAATLEDAERLYAVGASEVLVSYRPPAGRSVRKPGSAEGLAVDTP